MSPDVLVIDRLGKTYKNFFGRPTKRAVRSVSARIGKGEILGLIGPNGAGKTTTIKMILGLIRPTSGSVRIFGMEPTDKRVKERIGFLPEESYLHRFLSARETLDFYGSLFSIPKATVIQRREALLNKVGLLAAAERPVSEYSKGMARRLGLAQALINEPELLLLDEPTSGLDPVGTSEVKDLLIELKGRGVSILLCSHLLADMEGVCDRILMLADGETCLEGTVEGLLNDPDWITLTTRRPTQGPEDAYVKALKDAGAGEVRMAPSRRSLERLFLETLHTRRGRP
ncbi:MAG: ABC transporter ATP-binding protein [Planctomycetota bacterium]